MFLYNSTESYLGETWG